MTPRRRRGRRALACTPLALAATFAVALPAAAPPAAAVEPAAASACLPRPLLERRLTQGYGERPQARGVTAGGALIELWVGPGGRTFSLVLTPPSAGGRPGLSCLIGAGEGWRQSADPAGPEA